MGDEFDRLSNLDETVIARSRLHGTMQSMSVDGGAQYDQFAKAFEVHAEDSAYNAYYDRPALLDLAGEVRGLRVLDAGCGPGFYAEQLVDRGASVIAFDESREMVRLASLRLGDKAMVCHASVEDDLDWIQDASQDLIILALVLSHLDDRVKALRNLARVLTPHGRLIISTPHPTTDWLRLGGGYFEVSKVEDVWAQGWRVQQWRQPLERWCAEFAEAGFVIERLVEPRPIPEMASPYPEYFSKLNQEPGFIAFSLALAQTSRIVKSPFDLA